MATKKQTDDMVSTFIASIPTMQTDIALTKQDTAFLKAEASKQSTKSDAIIERLDKLSVVSPVEFEKHKKEVDERFEKLEDYNAENKPGVAFANALVSRWTTFLVLLILIAAIVVGIGHIVPLGG